MIHLQGMGWLGSACAIALARHGVEFTWHDTDQHYCAWRASTGSVYPAGDETSRRNLWGWVHWWRDGLMPAGTVERVDYVYTHKQPPHDGWRGIEQIDFGPYRMTPVPAFAVDVPGIVEHARERFADRRTAGPAAGERLLIAHGFGARMSHYLWGWSAPVRLDLPPDLAALDRRPAFYSKQGRWHTVYANPIPGEPGWWRAGSAMIPQRTPRELDAGHHRAWWLEAWRELWPSVPVVELGAPVQGWRPVPVDDDHGCLDYVDVRQDRSVPPLSHSGVRWAPDVVDAVVLWATT